MAEQNYITKVGKILSRQKSPNRVTLVSIFKPQNKEQKDHGVIYFIIEILYNDPTMGRVAKLIERTIIDKYYENLDDGLESLEVALKAVNEKLLSIADEGEIGWIGKINAAIAILEKNVLHITQTGTVEAYLIRENKITHVTENLSAPSEKTNPIKTFVNIASGDLKIGDKVIMSTSELFYHFSLDDLRRINAKFPPAIAATYIVKMLRKEEIESINTLILELAESEDDQNSIGRRLLIEEKNLVEQYNKKVVPAWKSLLSFSKKGVQKSIEKTKDVYGGRIAPTVNQITKEANKRVSEKLEEITSSDNTGAKENKSRSLIGILDKIKKPSQPVEPEAPVFQRAETKKTSGRGKKKIEEIITEDQQNIFEAPKNTPIRKIYFLVSKTYIKISDPIKKSKKKSQFFMTLAILLVVILLVSGTVSYRQKVVIDNRNKIEQAYNNLKNKTEGAVKANQLGDTKKAQSLLEEARNDIKGISSSSYMKDQIKALEIEINTATESVFNIQRFEEITPIANFTQIDQTIKVDSLIKIGDKLITIDKERHKGVSFSTDSKAIESIPSLTFDGTVEKTTPLNDKSVIAMLTGNPDSLYIYNSKVGTTEKVKQITEEPWPKAKAISSYLNNVYMLVPTDGQVYRYTSLINSYSNKNPYLVDKNIDLTNAVDLSIDGSVYILMKTGDVMKFSTGEKVEFNIHGFPQIFNEQEKGNDAKMLDPIRIIATESIPYIYIVDKGAKRVVVFDKEGAYRTQYVSSKWSDIKDFTVDGNTGYLLSGTELYQISLKS